MIYSVIVVDGDSGILLLEKPMVDMETTKKVSPDVLAGFFKALNSMIDDIQHSMKKGRDVSNMTRVVSSEGSTIVLYYQPQARILICSISDPDDNREKIMEVLQILGKRFWLKHRSDLDVFRRENIRDIFNSFSVEIDTYTLEGKVAEKFPKLLVGKNTLNRIKTMGVISDQDYEVARLCDGKTSSFKISRILELSEDAIKRNLNKLEDVDVVKQD